MNGSMSGLMPPCMQTSVAPRAIGLVDLAEHDVEAVGVGVRLPALALEGAELAVDEADVGEVDVAVDDVGDLVADVGGADRVGGAHQGDAGRRPRRRAACSPSSTVSSRPRERARRACARMAGRGAGDRALDGIVAQRDGLDLVPGIEPAHEGDASSAADAGCARRPAPRRAAGARGRASPAAST